MKVILNEDQRSLLDTSLRIAVEKYRENAGAMRMIVGEEYELLAQTFDQQAADALALADLLQGSESIEVLG